MNKLLRFVINLVIIMRKILINMLPTDLIDHSLVREEMDMVVNVTDIITMPSIIMEWVPVMDQTTPWNNETGISVTIMNDLVLVPIASEETRGK